MSATLAARARPDATLSMPSRRAAGRRQTSALARLVRWFSRRPGRAFIVLLFTAAAAAIVLNALVFQKTRHPAPMLSAPATAPAARPAERRAETPAAQPPQASPAQQAVLPPARPGDLAPGSAREAAPRPPAAVAATQASRHQAQPAPAAATRPTPQQAAARDPIADLINGSDLRPPAEIRGTPAAKARRAVAEN